MKRILFALFTFHFSLFTSTAQELKVDFVTPSIVRVQWNANGDTINNGTGICVYSPQKVKVKRTEMENEIILRSAELTVRIGKSTGSLLFEDNDENAILYSAGSSLKSEPVYQEKVTYDEKSAHVEETANGKVTVKDVIRRDTIGSSTRYYVSFHNEYEKALYGLGAHMEDYMNLQGKTMYLTQHNLKASVPMLLSTGGYGLLFDAGSAMKFTSDPAENHGCGHGKGYVSTMQIEAAKELDYYFIKGEKMEDIVAGYRYLTGDVTLLPRYTFGYTQSKERYVSSDDIIQTLKEYRRRHVPIDMIVQDWNYWPQGWGYMKMNPKFYPDPKALADSVHAMNAKLMVSIWPNPQWCPEAEDFKQRGMMLEHDVYDVFNPEARKHYWSYANDEFFSKGFDAWWCDSSEPLDGDWNRPPAPEGGVPYGWDCQARRWQLNKDVLSEALGAERSSLYSLYHSMGIYENQRAATPPSGVGGPRVLNLTRSTYAGQQRYATVVWNGDTHASWKSFKQQIPSGLNYMATGNPYWTVDVGSFFTRSDGRWFYTGEFPEGVKDDKYKEYYTRMFQWGTFLPMLRSHGSDTPREIWQFATSSEKEIVNGKLSSGKYYDAILKMINLRYTLIPYIYSMAAMQSNLILLEKSYTMARPLAFDFADDEQVLDLKDEYMFGNILVCPVTDPGVTTRKVYLPKGEEWIDFWTTKKYKGGQWIEASATIDKLPLFVKAGSIIPTTEVAEYTDAQVGKPITVNVYPGKDAEFYLYEDDGITYNFEKGERATVKLSWNDKKKALTISKPLGNFKVPSRDITVKIIGNDITPKTTSYTGKKTLMKL